MTTATVRIMSAEEITATAVGETAFLHLPQKDTVFTARTQRFAQLSKGHAMHDYLGFLADLAQAQAAILESFPSVLLPDQAALLHASTRALPPLPASDWARDPAWHTALRTMAVALQTKASPSVHTTLERILQVDAAWLELQADCLLTGVTLGLDMASAPIVAAALQAYWTHMVLEVQRLYPAPVAPFGRIADADVCPCCGSLPVASITHSAGDTPGLRYLACSLCNTRWNMPRILCTHCGQEDKVSYQSLDLADGNVFVQPSPEEITAAGARAAKAAIQAETCDHCGHYLKIMHQERDAGIDPVADDIASLSLDLLVSQTGMQKHGVNLMLLFGDGGAE
jgi:FdhE protein